MTTCSIVQCCGKKNKDNPKLTFHRLPIDTTLKKKWLEIIGEENIKKNLKRPIICSKHFDADSFHRFYEKVKLKRNAVPLLLPPTPLTSFSPSPSLSEQVQVTSFPLKTSLGEEPTPLTSFSPSPLLGKPVQVTSFPLKTSLGEEGCCHICLRNNNEVWEIYAELEIFYKTLCNFKHEKEFKFCSTCIETLQKCYDFKIQCILAVEKLKTCHYQRNGANADDAKLPSVQKSTPMKLNPSLKVNSLRKKILPKTNQFKHKLANRHVKQKVQKKCTPKQISSLKHDISKQMCVIKNEIKGCIMVEHDYAQEIVVENNTEQEIKVENETEQEIGVENETEQEIKVENGTEQEINVENNTTLEIKEENEENCHLEVLDDGYCDYQDLNESDLDVMILPKPKRKSKFSLDKVDSGISLVKNKEFMDDLKCKLNCKLVLFGEVKDKKGNVIDPNSVMNHLDKLYDRTLNGLMTYCSAPGPLKPKEIERLSIIQDRFKDYDQLFDIKFLSDETQMREEFEKRKLANAEYRCETCYLGFKNIKVLESHKRNTHNKGNPFVCGICQFGYRSMQRLRKHIMCLHSMAYKCKLCPDYTTQSRNLMINHYSKHMGLINTCEVCKKQFHSRSSFYLHMNTAHRSTSENVCKMCARTFHNYIGLNFHCKRIHNGEEFKESPENVKCVECDIPFINNDVYKKHLRITHKVDEFGNKIVSNRGRKDWSTESAREFLKKEHTCPVCKKKGQYGFWLHRHFKSEHPNIPYTELLTSDKRKHLCEECGESFKSSTSLREHKNVHIGNKPFSCDICPAKFYKKHSLTVHKARHEPPNYQCQRCGKRFFSSGNLYTHMLTHIGDRRFKCGICGKGFLHKAAVREHIKGVHCNIKRNKNKLIGQKILLYDKYQMGPMNNSDVTCSVQENMDEDT